LDTLLENIGKLMVEKFWLAPLLAFVSGLLTSFTPCCLSNIPLVIGYVGGTEVKTRKAFSLSLIFAIGSAVTFTVLGITASLMGSLIGVSSKWWYLVLGILMVLMALQTWEIFNFIPSTYLIAKNNKKGYIGAFVAGVLGGVFSSPCSTPVLIALLSIVAGKGNILWGALLLLFYSFGHGVLTVVVGTSIGLVGQFKKNTRYKTFSKIATFLMGTAILFIGFYMFYLAF